MLNSEKENIMRKYLKYLFLLCAVSLVSCESLVDDINDNPNELVLEDVDPELLLTGAQLANSVAQAGHLNRISAMWSGQLIGFTSLYSNIFGYAISTAESITTWSRIYVGVVPNVRTIRERSPTDKLLVGISKTLEAHAIGTAASLFGDIPYDEIFIEEIEDPRFDGQVAVFNSVIELLSSAISDLRDAPSRDLEQDIYFGGDAQKWLEAAYTLQARYYLQLKQYSQAYNAAQNGISSGDGTMKYIPRGDPAVSTGDKNLFWTILEGSRAGDIGTGESYLMNLINPALSDSRNNTKTDETARFGYYTIDESGGAANSGIIEQFEPHRLVAFSENQLILAECALRTVDFGTALGHLNDLRAYLNTGGYINANFNTMPLLYEAYEAADFDNGGMENQDGIDSDRALLREIIEERYVSGFGMYIPFNDARRLRKNDGDVAVPIPFNTSTAGQQPERLPYSDDELATNSNAPAEPGIFTKTEANQ